MRILLFLFIFLPTLTKAQAVYKTPSGAKYHLGTCRMVNNVSQKISLAEAARLGLTACKICKPEMTYSQPQTNNPQGQNKTVQCKGMTKAGTRCRHMTRITNGYCFQHNPAK
jgi:Family of unknown function (DUF5763)